MGRKNDRGEAGEERLIQFETQSSHNTIVIPCVSIMRNRGKCISISHPQELQLIPNAIGVIRMTRKKMLTFLFTNH